MKQILKIKTLLFLIGIMGYSLSQAQDRSLNFDGVKDFVQWGDPHQGGVGPYDTTTIVSPLVGSDFSIELWIKSDFTDWPGPHGVVFAFNSYNPSHASNRFILGINTSGRLYIHDGNNTGLSYLKWSGSTLVTDGECRHIAFTHDFAAKQCYVYVDGVLEGGPINTSFILDETDVFSVGQEWDNLDGLHTIEPHLPSQFFYGDMDDIRVWSDRRMEMEIFENQNTIFSPTEPDLLAYFKVDQGAAGNDNTAILNLENSTLIPGLDGDLNGFTKLTGASNFVLDPCAPCYASTDSSFAHITEDIEYNTEVVWDNKYYIADGKTVKVNPGAVLDITNVDVVFGQCAGIVVESGGYIRINNSVLRPCDVGGTWKGITFNGIASSESPSSIINESTFKNAEAALYFRGNSDALISNNLFSNCNYGVRVERNRNFKHSISGNRFVIGSFYPTYVNCHEFVDNLSTYGIWASGTNFTEHISHNEFINSNGTQLPMVTGISQIQGSSIASSNLFTDMLHAFVVNEATGYTSIANNRIEVNYPSSTTVSSSNISIFIESTNRPLVEINNNSLINNENQILAYAAIGLRNSSNISIATNEIEGFNRGITALNAHNCQITENEISNSKYVGIYFQQLVRPIPSPSFITCNRIKMKTYFESIGIYIKDMERANEISTNCILDCATSLYLEGNGRLPKVRNNYLYNYTNIGIDVRNYSGNIGVPSSDPGMNTLWSNDNTAFDINSFPMNIDAADNFGMNNVSLPYVNITSANPTHSTASCGHQIFDKESQGNLNPKYICDNKSNITLGLEKTEMGYELAPDFLDQLRITKSANQFINTIIGTVENLTETAFNEMISIADLDQNEERLLKYSFYLKKAAFELAKENLNAYSPITNEMEDFKQLRLMNLAVSSLDNFVFTEGDISFLAAVANEKGSQANYAIHLLNEVNPYRDYIFELPELSSSVKPTNLFSLDAADTYLKVYPNPAVNTLTIELEVNEENDVLQLVDLTGKIITSVSVNFVAGITEFDVSNLAPGIYYIVLTNLESGVKQKEKVIKMAE